MWLQDKDSSLHPEPEVLAATSGSLENHPSGKGKGEKEKRNDPVDRDPHPDAL